MNDTRKCQSCHGNAKADSVYCASCSNINFRNEPFTIRCAGCFNLCTVPRQNFRYCKKCSWTCTVPCLTINCLGRVAKDKAQMYKGKCFGCNKNQPKISKDSTPKYKQVLPNLEFYDRPTEQIKKQNEDIDMGQDDDEDIDMGQNEMPEFKENESHEFHNFDPATHQRKQNVFSNPNPKNPFSKGSIEHKAEPQPMQEPRFPLDFSRLSKETKKNFRDILKYYQ